MTALGVSDCIYQWKRNLFISGHLLQLCRRIVLKSFSQIKSHLIEKIEAKECTIDVAGQTPCLLFTHPYYSWTNPYHLILRLHLLIHYINQCNISE